MRVLIIDADEACSSSMEIMMGAERFVVHRTDSGDEGIGLACMGGYDLIVLDLALKDINGMDVIRGLRHRKNMTPILCVSSVDSMALRTGALNAGADGFLSKPVDRDELIAWCHAVVRRNKGRAANVITFNEISLDLGQQTVSINDQSVYFTDHEFRLFAALMTNVNRVMMKQKLLDQMYGGLDEPEPKILDVFVCRVRAKLKPFGLAHYVETVWGRGYIFGREPEPETALPSQMQTAVDKAEVFA